MSVIMELNAKGPFLWDWDNLVMFKCSELEATKRIQLVDSEIEGMEGFDVGSFLSSGNHSYGGTGSDLGYTSSSKSSKSASVNNNSNSSICGLTITSSTVESSVGSGESLVSLELGKRTYFEDVSGSSNVGNNPRTLPSDFGSKKPKSSRLGSEIPCCQVDGCNIDLSSAKDYHRKHRVCESHSKSTKVVIKGVDRRFCQQCSRFHDLSEFDRKKRSCRRRLSDHNARRRKPKPEVIQFNTIELPPSLYGSRNQLNLAFDQAPILQNKHGIDDLLLTHTSPQNPTTRPAHVSPQSTPSNNVTSGVYQQGLPISVAPSNLAAPQAFRALSLLSTSSWGPHNPEPSTLDDTMNTNHASLTPPLATMHEVPLGDGSPIVSGFWHSDHQPASLGHGSETSAFQLFKSPNESSFYLY